MLAPETDFTVKVSERQIHRYSQVKHDKIFAEVTSLHNIKMYTHFPQTDVEELNAQIPELEP